MVSSRAHRGCRCRRERLALCSPDAFIDCPTREQRSWVGDGVVHQMVHLATNSDWALARDFVWLADSPRPDGMLPVSVAGDIEQRAAYTIPDWALHWIHALHNLYRWSGDRERIKRRLPTAERILRWFVPYRTGMGLLKDVPEWTLVDWSSVSLEDTSALLTALWVRGLREFADTAGWLGEAAARAWAEGMIGPTEAGFEAFCDEERGTYVDHLVDGERRPETNRLAGALAIVAGLAPAPRWPRIVRAITDPEVLVVRSWLGDGEGHQSMERWWRQVREGRYPPDWDTGRQIVRAEPFMSYVVHDAVAAAGGAARLPDLLPAWSQFLENGYDTFGECWDFGTHAHGWSATPTRDLAFYTLGVTPARPGFARARVAPRLGRLSWVRGSVPTPYGHVNVDGNAERVLVVTPVPAEIALAGSEVVEVAAGQHRLDVRRTQ